MPAPKEPRDYPCACCGYLVFGEPPGTFEICPVCDWEDDDVQARHPRNRGGANRESIADLQRTQSAWKTADVARDPTWRPLGAREALFAPGAPPWGDLYNGAPPYYWRLPRR